MVFKARFKEESVVPSKVYIHETGIEVYRPDVLAQGINHYQDILEKNQQILSSCDFIIAALWGNDGKRISEVYKYFDIDQWPGNPTVELFSFKGTTYMPLESIMCEDTDIIRAEESWLRRDSINLEVFMSIHPDTERYHKVFKP